MCIPALLFSYFALFRLLSSLRTWNLNSSGFTKQISFSISPTASVPEPPSAFIHWLLHETNRLCPPHPVWLTFLQHGYFKTICKSIIAKGHPFLFITIQSVSAFDNDRNSALHSSIEVFMPHRYPSSSGRSSCYPSLAVLFRWVRWYDNYWEKFLLNSSPWVLRNFNNHESLPLSGMGSKTICLIYQNVFKINN